MCHCIALHMYEYNFKHSDLLDNLKVQRKNQFHDPHIIH